MKQETVSGYIFLLVVVILGRWCLFMEQKERQYTRSELAIMAKTMNDFEEVQDYLDNHPELGQKEKIEIRRNNND